MLRAGLIRKLAAGLYTWMPLGLRAMRKVENIVREEMNRAGALELLMPGVIPAELWVESGRWEQFGPELLRLKDRHERDFCLGPTHEEVITDIARSELKSYRQLPVNFYQIQMKFRDERRPRFGVMRAREFLMKDAYSFHTRPGVAAAGLRRHAPGLHAHLHAPGTEVPLGGRRYRRHRRQRLRGIPRAGGFRRGRHRVLRRRPVRRQSRDGGGAATRRRRARAATATHGRGRHAGRRRPSTTSPRLLKLPAVEARQDLVSRRHATAASWRCWCAAITS